MRHTTRPRRSAGAAPMPVVAILVASGEVVYTTCPVEASARRACPPLDSRRPNRHAGRTTPVRRATPSDRAPSERATAAARAGEAGDAAMDDEAGRAGGQRLPRLQAAQGRRAAGTRRPPAWSHPVAVPRLRRVARQPPAVHRRVR